MRSRHTLSLFLCAMLIATSATSQTRETMSRSSAEASSEVRAIAECVAEKDQARHQGVRDFSMDLTMMGHEVTQFFEQTNVTAANGEVYPTYRLVPPTEIGKRTTDPSQQLSPEALRAYADAAEQLGAGMEREMTESGLPVGMITNNGPAEGQEPWASPNPRVMMGSMAMFAGEAATADDHISDGRAEATENANDMSAFFNEAKYKGEESIDGKVSKHIRAENLNHSQRSNGQEFIVNNVSLWVDKEECVPLKFRMEGIVKADGQSREMFIESSNMDYRPVPNSPMYESYRQVMRMGGVMDAAEMAKMATAQAQLKEFDEKMAAMPPSQQEMMRNMMGPQMEMMRKMADTGAFEFETIVRAIRVNEGVAGALGHSGGAQTMMIEKDLTAPGYETGTVDGEVTLETGSKKVRITNHNCYFVTFENSVD